MWWLLRGGTLHLGRLLGAVVVWMIMFPPRLVCLSTWYPVGDTVGGSMLLEAGLESLKTCLFQFAFFALFLWLRCELSASCSWDEACCPLPAATIPCSEALYTKYTLPSISCFGHGVYHSNRQVIKIPVKVTVKIKYYVRLSVSVFKPQRGWA